MIFADVLPSFLIKRISLLPGMPMGAHIEGPDHASPGENIAVKNISSGYLAAKLDISIRNQSSLNWVRVPKLQEYIKIFVVQVTGKNLKRELKSKLYYPKTRYQELVHPTTDSQQDPLLVSMKQIAEFYEGESVDFKTLTLSDAVDQATTTGQFANTGYINRPHDFSTNNDITFSVAFPLDNNSPQDLCYFCFAHLNLRAVMNDYSSDTFNSWVYGSRGGNDVFNRLNQISSNLSYDTAIQDGKIPEIMTSYVFQGTGKPYVGPVRSQSPGIYAGLRTEVQDDGRVISKKVRLDKINHKNSKVVLLDSAQPSFSWGDAYKELSENDPLPSGNWYRYSYSKQFSENRAMGDNSSAIRRRSLSNRTESLLINQLMKQDNLQGFIEYSKNSIGNQEALIGFDYFNCIKQNSQFKKILQNLPDDLKIQVINRSNLLEATVTRGRVSNDLSGLGALGVSQKKSFDIDNIDEVIAKSRDTKVKRSMTDFRTALLSSGLRPSKRNNILGIISNFPKQIKTSVRPAIYYKQKQLCGDIEEVDVILNEESERRMIDYRFLLVNDYDFQNVKYGDYRYNLSLSIEDGTKFLLNQFRRQLKLSIKHINNFISFVVNNKGYDNTLKQYKRSLIRAISLQYQNTDNSSKRTYLFSIDEAIYNFVQLKRLTEPNGKFRSSLEESVRRLYVLVDPTKNSTLDNMSAFLQEMKETERRVSDILRNETVASIYSSKKKSSRTNVKDVNIIKVDKTYHKTSSANNSPIFLDYSGRYDSGVDTNIQSPLQKNLAALKVVSSKIKTSVTNTTQGVQKPSDVIVSKNFSLVFGNSTSNPSPQFTTFRVLEDSIPVLESGTKNLIIYPSSIISSRKRQVDDRSYNGNKSEDIGNARSNKILNSSEVGTLKNDSLVSKLNTLSVVDSFSKNYSTSFDHSSDIVSQNIFGDGLVIGTIGITKASKSHSIKDKDELVSESFNKVISTEILTQNKNKKLREDSLNRLKEQGILTNSSLYDFYIRFLMKSLNYTPYDKSSSNIAAKSSSNNVGDIKRDFFLNRPALIKHRTSFNNTRKEDSYTYIKGPTADATSDDPIVMRARGLKKISILKFEPLGSKGEENIDVINKTLFLEI